MIQLLLWISISFSPSQMSQVRKLFTVAAETEEKNVQLLKLTDGYTIDYKPIVYAYHAAAEMTMANHTNWPGTKLKYFNSGKEKLEKVCNKYPDLIEIRYIRYAVQKESPEFLGYRSNLTEDRTKILNNYKDTKWPKDFKNLVEEFVN